MKGRPTEKPSGLLSRLIGDVRANTLAIMAAAMIPLIGMIGGAIDLSRMYIVKTRLQHACDAGALAGRKAMGGGTWTQSSGSPGKAATQFFNANIASGAYGATIAPGQFRENAGKVTGTASATVPMTLMRVFGFNSRTLSVTCDAEMRLPNTDVMFVLDVTGSMGSRAVNTDPDTKIQSLRTAVKCFYEIVARLDTDANCTTGTPSGGTGDQVQIRFGFMPYASNVNVGKLLPPTYFANSWDYQSRKAAPPKTITTGTTWTQTGQTTRNETITVLGVFCNGGSVSSLNSTSTTTTGNTQTVTTITHAPTTGLLLLCNSVRTTTVTTFTGTPITSTAFDTWIYTKVTTPLGGLKNGSTWNSRYQLQVPIGPEGALRTVTWNGCIEERQTQPDLSFNTIPSAAYDMNIDLVPSQTRSETLWGPSLKDVIFVRDVETDINQANNSAETRSTKNFYNGIDDDCPTQARKLQSWPSAAGFDAYVDSLRANGNTYHDVGITWGARFMSPTGIFASENAKTASGGDIERHMIFMTDGDTVAAPCDYASHGVAYFDKRTTTSVGTAANCGNSNAALVAQVNNRFAALCTAVKNMNVTLWVISFGSGSSTTTETRLQTCASPNRYFTARNSAALQTTFKSIADQISQLRLTR